eukprot:5870820-Amphidinium_carterae.1
MSGDLCSSTVVRSGAEIPMAAVALAADSTRSWSAVVITSLPEAQRNIAELANLPNSNPSRLATHLQSGAFRCRRSWLTSGMTGRHWSGLAVDAHFTNPVALAARKKARHPECCSSVAQKVVGACSAQYNHRNRLLARFEE